MPRFTQLSPELAAETGLSVDRRTTPILETYGEMCFRYRLRAHPNVAALALSVGLITADPQIPPVRRGVSRLSACFCLPCEEIRARVETEQVQAPLK
jgi:hypothetical protein